MPVVSEYVQERRHLRCMGDGRWQSTDRARILRTLEGLGRSNWRKLWWKVQRDQPRVTAAALIAIILIYLIVGSESHPIGCIMNYGLAVLLSATNREFRRLWH